MCYFSLVVWWWFGGDLTVIWWCIVRRIVRRVNGGLWVHWSCQCLCRRPCLRWCWRDVVIADWCRQWWKFDTSVNVMVISGRLSRMSMTYWDIIAERRGTVWSSYREPHVMWFMWIFDVIWLDVREQYVARVVISEIHFILCLFIVLCLFIINVL